MRQIPNQNSEPITANFDPGMQQPLTVEGESFGRFIQFLKKRGWIVLLTVGVGFAAAVIVNIGMHKQYTAVAQIEIVPDMSSEFRLEQVQDFRGPAPQQVSGQGSEQISR